MATKWYFKTSILVIAFLCVGPFALPLVWLNPNFSRRNKIIISIIAVILSCLLAVFLIKSIQNIVAYYQLLFQEI